MKRSLFRTFCFFCVLMIFFISCKKDDPEPPQTESKKELNIPEDFNFMTEKVHSISVTAVNGNTSVDVYIYSEQMKYIDAGEEVAESGEVLSISETFENKIHSAYILSGQTHDLKLTIPNYLDKLYVVTRTQGTYKSSIIDVSQNRSQTSVAATSSGIEDVLYCVNAQGDLFSVNPITGEENIFGTLPSDMGGSVTCAMDNDNDILYTIGRVSPYKLYSYDIHTEEFTYKGDVGRGGPRLEFREVDGKLYFSTGNKIYKLDPSNGSTLATYTVNGLHNTGWGDVAFTEDGTLFMATYSGLYRLDDAGNSTYNAVRISADNLPFNATSLTFDSNGELWLATVVGGQGKLIIMDQVTGGWEYRFDPYPVGINDLTTLLLDPESLPTDDDDGDGVPNYEDDYPDDPEASGNTYTPSIYGWGSYAFEDLWPFKGDYDFNDLVVNHRGTIVSNSNNEIVRLEIRHQIKNIGASYTNGFGYVFPNLPANKIESISGQNLTEDVITNNANGVEAGHDQTVVIVFDNAFLNEQEFNLVIEFTEPIAPSVLGIENIDPFIFVDKDRTREIHLSGKAPTALAENSTNYFGKGDDNTNPSEGRYYKDNNNMPWAISIIHDFIHPKEKHNIMDGYVRFKTWAESGGNQYLDWYKDQDGNRNYSHLESQ